MGPQPSHAEPSLYKAVFSRNHKHRCYWKIDLSLIPYGEIFIFSKLNLNSMWHLPSEHKNILTSITNSPKENEQELSYNSIFWNIKKQSHLTQDNVLTCHLKLLNSEFLTSLKYNQCSLKGLQIFWTSHDPVFSTVEPNYFCCLNKNNKNAHFCIVSAQNSGGRKGRTVGWEEFHFTVLEQPKLKAKWAWWVRRTTGTKTKEKAGMECYYSFYIYHGS